MNSSIYVHSQYWSHYNGQAYRVNGIVNAFGSPGFLSRQDYIAIGELLFPSWNVECLHQFLTGDLVLSQCDDLDGLRDGIITDPSKCKPDLTPLACQSGATSSSSNGTCLTSPQMDTMYTLYADWRDSQTGDWLFPGYEPGSEASIDFFATGELVGELLRSHNSLYLTD